MNDTPDLFATHYPDRPGHRHTDTSIAAALSLALEVKSLREQCLNQLRFWGPQTADEVADRLKLSILSIRPRITELKRMGLIRDTGHRRLNRSAKYAAVMEVIYQGERESGESVPPSGRDMAPTVPPRSNDGATTGQGR